MPPTEAVSKMEENRKEKPTSQLQMLESVCALLSWTGGSLWERTCRADVMFLLKKGYATLKVILEELS